MSRRIFGSFGGIPANPSLVPPIRGAFYFPWYDEHWDQLGYEPFTVYTPTLGEYDLKDVATMEQHFIWAAAANIDVLIPTWRGNGVSGPSVTTFGAAAGHMDAKIGTMLGLGIKYGIKVAVYYEVEGYTDPSAAAIEAEFAYLATRYFRHPAYLFVDGLPVIFVYSPGEGSTMLARYSDATDGFTTAYINAIYTDGATPAPQGRHTFTHARAVEAGNSYTILPGFWRIDEEAPRTARDLETWQGNIADMVASGKDWQLIISFNEWGEGSSIEPADEYGTDYLDAL